MSPSQGDVIHVSDTALMVAACRALESEAPDAFVRDPFAARLAGERGMAMFRALPHPEMMRFGIAIRSHFLDELVLETVASNIIATVVSLGCGLDTRPWRLDLPPVLRWIEVDFPDMLEYKEGLMAGETPRCRRERLIADLSDPDQRRAVYAAIGPAPALMITEGLMMYLPAASVEALAAEPPRACGVAHWLCDIATSAFNKAVTEDNVRSVSHVRAADSLEGEQILDCIYRNGWVTAARRSYITDMDFAADRIQALMGVRPQPETLPPFALSDPTGIHRFTRS